MGLLGQGSSARSGIWMGLSVGLLPWLNQSRIMNCSQLATRALAPVAGWNLVLVISVRLTSRGFGVRSAGSASGKVFSRGTLRPNRDPAMPIVGCSRSLYVPSAVRVWRNRPSYCSTGGVSTAGRWVVSKRFFLRSTSRTPMRTTMPRGVGSLSHPNLWSAAVATLS